MISAVRVDDDKTMEDLFNEWCKEVGHDIPKRKSEEWERMYTRWVAKVLTFSDKGEGKL